MNEGSNHRPLISAGTLLGIGLGGFVDGIIFHQLLQVHNMLSARYPIAGLDPERLAVNLEINMFWDGLFHAFCWIMTAFGLGLLWQAVQRWDSALSTKVFVGSLAMGWGIFNLVEGVIDHHLLHIHHVVEGANHLVWDLAFLASGLVLLGIGLMLIKAGISGTVPRPAETISRGLPHPG